MQAPCSLVTVRKARGVRIHWLKILGNERTSHEVDEFLGARGGLGCLSRDAGVAPPDLRLRQTKNGPVVNEIAK